MLGRAVSARFRQTEVEHFDDAVRRDLDVGRFEIAVNDALVVRGFERARDVARDRQRLPRLGLSAFGLGLSDVRARRRIPEPLIRSASVRPSTSSSTRPGVPLMSAIPWMAQMFGWLSDCEQMRFAIESRETIRIDAEDRRQDLDRDVASERRVTRAIDLAHPSRAEQRQQVVRAVAAGRLGEDFHGRTFCKVAGRVMSGEQRLHFSMQRRSSPQASSRNAWRSSGARSMTS